MNPSALSRDQNPRDQENNPVDLKYPSDGHHGMLLWHEVT